MKAVIIHHQDDAPAGLLLDRLSACGVDWRVVDLGRGEPLPEPESVRLAVSLGSDASADDARDWIARELDWLRAADRAGTAILGLCFGAQALAVALGGGVARAGRPERGWITISTAEPELVACGPWLSWHDDVIELPPGARLIAENACGPQAFAAGRHLGVQFHPEVTPEIVADWVLSARSGELDADTAVDSSAPQWPGAVAAAERLFDGFAARVRRGSGW